jgi:hypothetical protein
MGGRSVGSAPPKRTQTDGPAHRFRSPRWRWPYRCEGIFSGSKQTDHTFILVHVDRKRGKILLPYSSGLMQSDRLVHTNAYVCVPLMHAKCIHELCTLLRHIPHIVTYMMLYLCFILICGDLPMIPFICVITLQNRKTQFCVFFTFTDLYRVKLS